MKNTTENNQELQIILDGFAQTLEEVKEAVLAKNEQDKNNGNSALNTDLLNKITETIEYAKKAIDEEDLKRFLNAVINAAIDLREKADKAFTEFLNQKIEELNQLVKQPSIVKNHYSIDFKSSKMFIVVLSISLALLCSLCRNYNQYQENSKLMANDLKYRFVKMRNGILPDEITRLENFFYYPDSVYVVENIRKEVVDYEHRMEEQARKLEQKRQSEETINKLDKEIEKLDTK